MLPHCGEGESAARRTGQYLAPCLAVSATSGGPITGAGLGSREIRVTSSDRKARQTVALPRYQSPGILQEPYDADH